MKTWVSCSFSEFRDGVVFINFSFISPAENDSLELC